MFCAPMEIERSILSCSGKGHSETIEVSDVIRWTISETCMSIRKCVPLWATQGMRYQHRHVAWSKTPSDGGLALEEAESLLEPESQTLQQRYGIQQQNEEERVVLQGAEDSKLAERKEQVEAIREKCREYQVASFRSATLQEEQERELSPENEQERQVERPHALPARPHTIHPDVRRYIETGQIMGVAPAFRIAFDVLRDTGAGKMMELTAWPSKFLVTADYAQTVQAPKNQLLDDYLRPVNWIASSQEEGSRTCVVLSPYEAHHLLPALRRHGKVTLHVYSPRVNQSMRTLEDLSFCAIPPVREDWKLGPLTLPLNLFAGQLYLQTYDEYLAACRFLGLCFRAPEGPSQALTDGFVVPAHRQAYDEAMKRECRFEASPVEFLRRLMTMRRKGQSFHRSHIGRILMQELLAEHHF
jgi:hypothetical protein